jgi:hypothetical protein
MEYEAFLTKVIDDGIEAAKKSYASRPDKSRGAVAGFEACRGKSPEELKSELESAGKATEMARICRASNYWEVRCYEAEVEWILNCVSAAMNNPKFSVKPTVRGLMKAAEVLGIKDENQVRST